MKNKTHWLDFRYKSSYDVLNNLNMMYVYPSPISIAKIMQVEVLYVSNPGWTSAARSDDSNATIWINKDQDGTRIRFAVGYELGRLLLGPKNSEWRDISPGIIEKTNLDKRVGNWARSLIMPRWLIQPLMYETKLTVQQMADLFIVPVMQVGIRLDTIRKAEDSENDY